MRARDVVVDDDAIASMTDDDDDDDDAIATRVRDVDRDDEDARSRRRSREALEARDAMRVRRRYCTPWSARTGFECAADVRAMVEIFAHGTLGEYRARRTSEKLPTLTTREEAKLRRLSTCALCAEGGTIAYERLMRELEFTSERAMETFVVDECLGEIVWGRLDPKNKVLRVRRAKERDARSERARRRHRGRLAVARDIGNDVGELE